MIDYVAIYLFVGLLVVMIIGTDDIIPNRDSTILESTIFSLAILLFWLPALVVFTVLKLFQRK